MKDRSAKIRDDAPAAANAPAKPPAAPTSALLNGRATVICLLAAAGLWQVYFPPVGLWPLGALIPALLAVASLGSVGLVGRRWFFVFWLIGTLCWIFAIYWMSWVTPIGWLGLAIYMGLYWPVGSWLLRRLDRFGLPTAVSLPVVWVTLEIARARLMSGFPWFLLAHGLYRHPLLIQTADFAGAYGASFVIAAVGGALADLLLARLARRRDGGGAAARRCCGSVAVAAVLSVGTLGYGWFRLAQADAPDAGFLRPGPTVAVAQSAFPISIYAHRGFDPADVLDGLIADSPVGPQRPADLLIWPETVLPDQFRGPIGREITWPQADLTGYRPEAVAYIRMLQDGHRRLADLLRQGGDRLVLLTGGLTRKIVSDRPGDGGLPAMDIYNSAMLVRPATRRSDEDAGRLLEFGPVYGKMHCVPFGEYTPFRFTIPPLYAVLRKFVPEQMDQLTPGRLPLRFEIDAADGERYGFATAICYEGVIARVCRRLVWRGEDADGSPVAEKADFLVNISNDGWFIWPFGRADWPSAELDQHLSAYPFRAIENRLSVVRSVNTGISCVFDSSGRMQAWLSDASGRCRMVRGSMRARLTIDGRRSFYGRFGDVLAWCCCAATAAALFAGRFVRGQGKNSEVTV